MRPDEWPLAISFDMDADDVLDYLIVGVLVLSKIYSMEILLTKQRLRNVHASCDGACDGGDVSSPCDCDHDLSLII